MKKIILILLLLPLFIGNVYAVGSSGSTGGDSKIYAKSVKIESNPGKLRIGDKYTFKAKLDPSNASTENLTWTSSDPKILSIDNNGNAIANNKGTVKVTVKTNNGKTDSVAVTVNLANTTSGGVKKVKTVSITSYPDEMIVGNTFKLQTKISPSLVDNNKLTFKSDNEKVLTVDSNGLITAKKKGETTITVTSVNGKTAKVTIKVVNAKVTLSKSSMTVNEGETKEITVKIESNKQYSASDLKWATGNEKVTKVETISSGNNTFKAKVYGLSKGVAMISANIDGAKDRSKITVKEVGRDTSLECPLISYDTSDNEYIKINITPASTTDHFDYAVSTNKTSGQNAKWKTVNSNLKGGQTFTSKYTDAQGKIRIYGKDGTSRDCYTAPFDLDGSKKSETKIGKVSTYECPTFITDKIDKVNGAKNYTINLYATKPLTTGVRKAYIKIVPNHENLQYSWYTNQTAITDDIEYGKWKLFNTFNGKNSSIQTLTTSDENFNDRQGLILLTTFYGNVQICYTGSYNSLNLKSKTTVNSNTDIYVENGYSYDSDKMIDLVKQLPKYYVAAPNIFLLTDDTYKRYQSIGGSDSCGVTMVNQLFIIVRGGGSCNEDYSRLALIHELAHSTDFLYWKINGKCLSCDNSINSEIIKYKSILTNGKSKYLRDYSYTNNYEFWADLSSINYLNKSSLSSLRYNSYKNYWLVDSNLNELDKNKLDKIKSTYNNKNSEWNKYKEMYR